MITKIFKDFKSGVVVEKLSNDDVKLFVNETELREEISKTKDSAVEKHVPFVEENENGILVKIGESEKHPMTEEHYIMFIEVITKNNELFRKYLKPNDLPEAQFSVKKSDILEVREYCNLHGLWKN